jgi:hypothetical protein
MTIKLISKLAGYEATGWIHEAPERFLFILIQDRPYGFVVRVPDYISRGPISIFSATGFSKK